MSDQERPTAKAQVIEALRRLAANPQEQVEWLREIGVYPSADELALDLDDCLDAFMATQPDPAVRSALAALSAHLDSMSGLDVGVWNADGLGDERWQRAREFAARALALLR